MESFPGVEKLLWLSIIEITSGLANILTASMLALALGK